MDAGGTIAFRNLRRRVDWVCCIWDLPGEGGAERGERRGAAAAAGDGEEGRGEGAEESLSIWVG